LDREVQQTVETMVESLLRSGVLKSTGQQQRRQRGGGGTRYF
jgi:hypothetical protein